MFAETGKNSKVTDLEVNYNFFQPNIRAGEEYNLTFGGISAYNHGEIVNSKVKYQNFTIATSNNLTFGGVVGVNTNIVTNNIVVPTIIATENVGGLRSANEGEAFKVILQDLKDAGYKVYPHLYKFEEGVYQKFLR